jgi:RNA polymerase sigma-70 factor (ECF subfamily)
VSATFEPDRLQQLLHQAQGGSPEALGQLLEVFRPYLLCVASEALNVQLQAKGGASDLVQETFLEAQRHRRFPRPDRRGIARLAAAHLAE